MISRPVVVPHSRRRHRSYHNRTGYGTSTQYREQTLSDYIVFWGVIIFLLWAFIHHH